MHCDVRIHAVHLNVKLICDGFYSLIGLVRDKQVDVSSSQSGGFKYISRHLGADRTATLNSSLPFILKNDLQPRGFQPLVADVFRRRGSTTALRNDRRI